MNGHNKRDCYISLGWKGFPLTNTLANWEHSQVTKKMKCCEYGPWYHIHNTSFSLSLMNGPKRLECYITLGWKGLQGRNTRSYWAYS